MRADGDAELLVDAGAEVAEGPIWDDRRKRLLWVDILGARLHTYDPATGEDESLDVGQPVGAAVPRERGGAVLAVHTGFALLDPDGELRMVAEVEADRPGNRMNDGACDRAGRFWAGTMAFEGTTGAGSFYRLDPDGTVTTALEGVSISNGVGWSLDDATMYYVDSPEGIDAFDFDLAAGAIENRRRLATVPEELGVPDGLTVDAEGFIWVAIFGGGRVQRYAPDGTLDREVYLPVTRVTKPAFGGPNLDELYVTTAWEGMSEAERREQPGAGGLWRLDPGARGLPPNRFAG
jgi:sugar lactone lactonase YvrE